MAAVLRADLIALLASAEQALEIASYVVGTLMLIIPAVVIVEDLCRRR